MVRKSAPDSSRWVAKQWRLCRMRHRRHYAAFRTMPHVDVKEPVHSLRSPGDAAYFDALPGTLGR